MGLLDSRGNVKPAVIPSGAYNDVGFRTRTISAGAFGFGAA